jgi:hypothetical protein
MMAATSKRGFQLVNRALAQSVAVMDMPVDLSRLAEQTLPSH